MERLRRPCGLGELRFHRRTVWSSEEEQKVSFDGQREREVTVSVWPLK